MTNWLMSKSENIHGLDITVTRSKRKTVSIFVERDGSVSARIPEKLSIDELAETVKKKQYLIHKHLAEWEMLNDSKVKREFVNGQSFMYLGKNYRLKIVDNSAISGRVRLHRGYFEISKNDIPKATSLFQQFYKAKLEEKLPGLLGTYQKRLDLFAARIKVMELQNRWASCSLRGTLSFHWKCAMAPIDVLNYIVVHELIHLRYPNHSPAFWDEVDRAMPHYKTRDEWLRLNGAGMDL